MKGKFKLYIVLLLICSLLFVSLSSVSAIAVEGSTFTDLNEAIYYDVVVELENNITVSDEELLEYKNGIVIDKSVTIDGNGFVIDGRNIVRIFELNNDEASLTLVNITLMNGNADYGGAIYAYAINLIDVEGDVWFKNNHATESGGAIYANNSDVSFNGAGNLYFINNTAINQGGSIYTKYMAILYTKGSMTFNYNAAGGDGGVIYSDSGNVNIFSKSRNIAFNNNKAGGNGGAIYAKFVDFNVFSIVFNNNIADYSGGAIYTWGSDNYGYIKIITNGGDVRFISNKAGVKGAVISGNNIIINTTILTGANNIANNSYDGASFNTLNNMVTLNNKEISCSSFGQYYTFPESTVQIICKDVIMYYKDGTKLIVELRKGALPLVGKTIYIKLNGNTYPKITDSNGIVSMDINLIPGNYDAIITYENLSTTANILIYGKSSITASDMVVRPDQSFIFTAVLKDYMGNPFANQNVSFFVNYEEYSAITDSNGKARVNLKLDKGEYSIVSSYSGNGYITGSNVTNKIIVKEESISLIANDLTMYYKDGSKFTVVLKDGVTPLVGETIKIELNGNIYSKVTDSNGVASMDINLNPGAYYPVASYKDLTSTATILVYGKSSISASDMVVRPDQSFIFTAVLKDYMGVPFTNQNVTFFINYEEYSAITDSNGKACVNLKLDEGEYSIVSSYSGSGYITGSNVANKIIVQEESISLIANDLTMYYKDGSKFTVVLKDGVTPLVGETIKVELNGNSYSIVTDSNGVASMDINLNPGAYYPVASYKDLTSTATILVYGKSSITASDMVVRPNQSFIFTAILKDFAGNPFSYQSVSFLINGEEYNIFTDSNGKASVDLILDEGTYDIITSYDGTDFIIGFNKTNKITVSEKSISLIANDLTMYYKDGSKFTVVLKDGVTPLVGETIKIELNGNTYSKITDSNGVASMNINLDIGTYSVTASYKDLTSTATIDVISTIYGDNITKIYKNGTQYSAKFLDSKGNLLINTDVQFNINGVFYTRTTDSNGVAHMNINLNTGNYILTATNPVNGQMFTNIITVLSSIVGKDITKIYKNGTQYSATFYKGDGSFLANTDVQFNINGVFYTRTTDDNGVATMNINLNPGTYVITAIHPINGQLYSNTIKVLPIIIASDLTMKYHDGSKFVAKLIDGSGKPIIGNELKFNVNGVFYYKITDSNGDAKLNINLDVGEYIITSEYNGFMTSNKILITN